MTNLFRKLKLIKIKKIGMRTIKTALAVALSIATAQYLKLEYPFFAAIAALVSMETSVFESFNAGRNRMVGTIVGASTGLLAALVAPNNVIMSFLGIIVVIYILIILGANKSIVIACIVFCSILVNLNGKDPIYYSFDRILDTIIGISIATAINYLILPHDIFEKANEKSKKLKLLILSIDSKALPRLEDDKFSQINKEISGLDSIITMCSKETFFIKHHEDELSKLKIFLKYCKEVTLTLQILSNMEEQLAIPIESDSQLETVHKYHLHKLSLNINNLVTLITFK